MQSINENIRVAIRIKTTESRNTCVTTEGNNIIITDPGIRKGSKTFGFDRVFPSISGQEDVYQVVSPIIEQCLEGYNGCIFAYGQTSSGKTYTMQGLDGDVRGVIPRVAEQIMDHVRNRVEIDFVMKGSYLEIYQEQLRDLLQNEDSNELRIRMDPLSITGKELYVDGLTEIPLDTAEDFAKLIEMGTKNRTVAATNMNQVSSRSHAVFTLTIEQSVPFKPGDMIMDGIMPKKRSKIHLIDLAGSERVDSTGAVGQRLKEGTAINLSLSSLGNVISALSTRASHIPYRDSKLTYLLSDSLGGNSLTLVLGCISPLPSCYEETKSTLRFAERAKKVQNQARVNIDPTTMKIMELEEEIERLRALLAQCTCKRRHPAQKDCNCTNNCVHEKKKLSWYQRWVHKMCCNSSRGVVTPINKELSSDTIQ